MNILKTNFLNLTTNFFIFSTISFFFFIFSSCSIKALFSLFLTNPSHFSYSDPAMLLFSSLLEFHNDIMFFLCQIILLVFFILFYTFFYITRFNSFSFLSAYSVLYVFIFFVIFAFYSFFLSNLFVNSLESSFFFFNFNVFSVITVLFILYFSFILAVFFGNYFFNSDSAFEPIFLLSLETFLLNFFFSFSNQNLGFENDTAISKKTLVYQTKKPVVFELVLETL